MARWRIPVACALAIAAAPGVSAAFSLDEVVSVFRQGCLEQLPDLSGSEAEFRRLGFVGDRLTLQLLDGSGGWMLASVIIGGFYGASACSLGGELPIDSPVGEAVDYVIGELITASISRSDHHTDGRRGRIFEWQAGGTPAIVEAAQLSDGMFEFGTIAGELPW